MPFYLLLLSAFRNLWRNKLHTLINLASLALGLAVFSFAFLYVKQETSYDRGFADAARLHRVISVQHGLPGRQDGESSNVLARNFPLLMENFGDSIEQASRVYTTYVKPEAVTAQNSVFNLTIVEPAFVDLFKLEVISGSLATVMQGPGFIALEESVVKNFPEPVTLGSRIKLEGRGFNIPGKPNGIVEYQVGAIYRLPKTHSSQVDFRMLTLMHDYSLQLFPKGVNVTAWNDSTTIWLKLKPGVDLVALYKRMPDYVDRVVTNFNSTLKTGDHVSNHLSFRFQTLTDLHFHPIGTETFGQQPNESQMLTIAAIGVLVLLVGCSNSISLSLAAVLERRRDIGIHKAVGALQRDILMQYLGESAVSALLALGLALLLVQWLLPVFATLLRIPQNIAPQLPEYAMLGAIAALVGLASGAYPALVLAGVKPQDVLKTGVNSNSRGNHRLRTLLVGFQFCFAVMLLTVTLALFLQMRVLRSQPLGFNPHNLMYLAIQANGPSQTGPSPILDRVQKIPGVVAVTAIGNPPNVNFPETINSQKYLNRNDEQIELSIHTESLGADALAMLQIPLLAGRQFDAARDTRNPDTGRNADQANETKPEGRLLLNRAAVKGLGFANPLAAVDQTIYTRFTDKDGKVTENPTRIIGVIEDSLYNSLRRKPGPEGFSFMPAANAFGVMFKYEDAVAGTIQEELKRIVQEMTHSNQTYLRDVETQLAAEFTVEQNQSKLLLYCGGLALFLSCIGLFGLASFTMQRGIKEVGVRKVMGASVASLTALYLWRYAKPVLIATVLASPIAVYFILEWIQRFPYQLEKWWLLPLCLTAGGTVLVIALLTVAGIVVKAARAKPVQSLRYE